MIELCRKFHFTSLIIILLCSKYEETYQGIEIIIKKRKLFQNFEKPIEIMKSATTLWLLWSTVKPK